MLRRVTLPRPVLIPLWILHRFVYRATSGRVGRRLTGVPTLLLTTVGRKSGQPRQASLMYLEDGTNLVVIASNAGSDRDPAWWLNLETTPDAIAWVGAERRRVHARRASPAELERLWPRLVELYPGYQEYGKRTGREFPVVILERRS